VSALFQQENSNFQALIQEQLRPFLTQKMKMQKVLRFRNCNAMTGLTCKQPFGIDSGSQHNEPKKKYFLKVMNDLFPLLIKIKKKRKKKKKKKNKINIK